MGFVHHANGKLRVAAAAPNHTPPYESTIQSKSPEYGGSSNAGDLYNDWGVKLSGLVVSEKATVLWSKERARWTTNHVSMIPVWDLMGRILTTTMRVLKTIEIIVLGTIPIVLDWIMATVVSPVMGRTTTTMRVLKMIGGIIVLTALIQATTMTISSKW